MNRLLIAAALATFSSVAAAQRVNATLSEWTIVLSRDTVDAGKVTFSVSNEGSMSHGFHVSGAGVEKETREIGKGESATLTLTLKPGTYTIDCPLSGGSHKMAGMSKAFVVLPGEPSTPARKKPAA